MIFRRVFLTALVAGTAAGLVLALLQSIWVTPLILEGERYEQGADNPEKVTRLEESPPASQSGPSAHEQILPRAEAAGSGPVISRGAGTVLSDVVAGVGFALILVGCIALRGRPVGLWQGLLWGLAGYAVFALAPALGLPPELPGAVNADLGSRQLWWAAAVASTAAGLALTVFSRGWPLRGVGLLVLAVPHMLGAPHVNLEQAGAPPEELVRQFILVSLASTAAFWLLLGGLVGYGYGRFGGAIFRKSN